MSEIERDVLNHFNFNIFVVKLFAERLLHLYILSFRFYWHIEFLFLLQSSITPLMCDHTLFIFTVHSSSCVQRSMGFFLLFCCFEKQKNIKFKKRQINIFPANCIFLM